MLTHHRKSVFDLTNMVETKLFFLFSIFALTVVAVPPKPHLSGKLAVEKFQKELQLVAKHNAGQAKEIFNQRNFRLPNNTEPVSYNVRLSTDIHRGDFGFQGDVTINVIVLEASNTITLHSRHTIIERIDLFNPNGTLYEADLPYIYDSEVHFLVIPVTRELETGQELNIEITYQGFIRSELNGFFRNSYYDPFEEQEAFLATTQLSPVNARQAFPSYDEPRYRRPIALQIRHHRSYNAISNMPVAELVADGEYVTTIFEVTPPIATYTLTFTVSNFDFVENTDTNVTLRVYARRETIQLGLANDGLRLAEIMLREMQAVFNIPYHLPKSDLVTIPSLNFAGFEGWGLITHLERILLRFSDDPVAQRLREIRIGHEYAHIYFGNLVTPSSWAFLWMSEGMSRMYENILITRVFPEENGWQQFLMEYMDQAITLDVMGLLPALNLYAETPEEINDKFNFATWNKGAIILRMFGEAISTLTWLKGVTNYLLSNEFENASPEDLYDGIQEAYDEDFPGSGFNFTELMSPWFDFEGYPIVTVGKAEQGLTFIQAGFRTLHDQIFPIPINYASASHPDFTDTRADFWMSSSRFVISRDDAPKPWTDDDWIIVNLRDSYYYVTNYEDNLWELIINALNDDHEAIHFLNRGTLFADFHRFIAQNFDVSIIYFLRMMESLPLEFEPHVWNRAALGLNLAEVRIRGTEFDREYRNFVQEIMSQIYGETLFDDRSARDLINEWSCLSGVQECLDDALEILLEVMETGDTAYGFDYQCNGLRAANESIWMEFYYDVVDSRPPEERYPALDDLLCSENENLVQYYLNQLLNTTNSLSIPEREMILTTAATKHIISSDLLIGFIELNNEAVNAITNIPRLVLELAIVTNNYDHAERLLSLLQFGFDEGITEEFLVETLRPNLDFVYRNSDSLREWFDGRKLTVK